MKKLIVTFTLILATGLLFGCGTAAQRSEFWQHDSMYKNWDHLKYSWSEYKADAPASLEKSKAQKWWGLPVEDGQVK